YSDPGKSHDHMSPAQALNHFIPLKHRTRFLRSSLSSFILFTLIFLAWNAPPPVFPEPIKENYPGGTPHFERNVDENGLPHGPSREYFKNGILKAERNYDHGRLDGLVKLYYPNGNIETEFIYKQGKREGLSIGYYKNGKLKDKGHYKDDKLEGPVRMFSSDGRLKAEMLFKKDLPEGSAKTYYPDGGLQYIYTYRKGRVIHRKDYDTRGKLIREREFPITSVQP
ncbi:MAG: toxin-antitoxin system YwqK family antitoxin, partial [Nitrospinaceae bacterium]